MLAVVAGSGGSGLLLGMLRWMMVRWDAVFEVFGWGWRAFGGAVGVEGELGGGRVHYCCATAALRWSLGK